MHRVCVCVRGTGSHHSGVYSLSEIILTAACVLQIYTSIITVSVTGLCSPAGEKKSPFECFFFGTQRRRSHFSLPVLALFSLLAPLSRLIYWETLCTALQTERLWIWSTGLSTQLTPSSRWEACVLGNLSALTERSQLATRWTRGRGVSSGSFRGGHWRYLPIRNHDNMYFADWIRLCPGLSKNSENGNSCLKPHKAARLDWSSGKSGQHWGWDY